MPRSASPTWFERYFVPAVLGLVVLLVIDEPFSDSFYRAMAVLVAASPYALVIATPSAVLSGVACGGRGGVLVNGGGPLENLGTLTVIAFDKTGMLTDEMPERSPLGDRGQTSNFDLKLLSLPGVQFFGLRSCFIVYNSLRTFLF